MPQFMLALSTASEGFCHPVRSDLGTLVEEFKSGWSSRGAKASLVCGAQEVQLFASQMDGITYARGMLPAPMLVAMLGAPVELRGDVSGTHVLQSSEALPLEADMCTNIAALLDLEQRLAQALGDLNASRDGLTIEKGLASASDALKSIRVERQSCIARLAKRLPYPLLKSYLENFVDALVASEDALQRLVSQFFLKFETSDIVKVAQKVDMLTERDKQAIAAGAKSLQSGLGGFVAKRYDRQVAKIIATKGAWARKLLARKCKLVRTETNPKDLDHSDTWLSLFIFENASVGSYPHSHITPHAQHHFSLQ